MRIVGAGAGEREGVGWAQELPQWPDHLYPMTPTVLPNVTVHGGDVPRSAEHEADRVLGNGARAVAWYIADANIADARGLHVDVICRAGGQIDHGLQARMTFQDAFGDLQLVEDGHVALIERACLEFGRREIATDRQFGNQAQLPGCDQVAQMRRTIWEHRAKCRHASCCCQVAGMDFI